MFQININPLYTLACDKVLGLNDTLRSKKGLAIEKLSKFNIQLV